jgi:tyrosine-protein phosphatase SIW14
MTSSADRLSRIMRVNVILPAVFFAVNTIPACAQAVIERPAKWAMQEHIGQLENCFLVKDGFYRSEQPSRSDFRVVDSMGVKTIVNLRNVRKDNRKSRGTNLKLVHIPINTWRMSYADVVSAMKAIDESEKPVLLHCIHGSDRTGVVTAAYRMVHQGWTKEEAVDEFLHGGYGYHSGWFPNILRLLESLEIDKLKKDIAIHSNP